MTDWVTWLACSKLWKGLSWYMAAIAETQSWRWEGTAALSSISSGFCLQVLDLVDRGMTYLTLSKDLWIHLNVSLPWLHLIFCLISWKMHCAAQGNDLFELSFKKADILLNEALDTHVMSLSNILVRAPFGQLDNARPYWRLQMSCPWRLNVHAAGSY